MSLTLRSALVLGFGAALGLTLSLGAGVLAERNTAEDTLPWDEARLLAEVLERVKQEYVEPVDDSVLIESAVRGMVTDLDPHSQFLDVDEYEEIRISTTGNYSGVGLEVHMEGGTVTVVAPIEDTPAEKAGIKSGDIIIAIDDIAVDEQKVNDTISRMRGTVGTRVKITVRRESEPEPLDFIVIRGHVQVKSVRAALLEPDYAYVRLTHFSETTYKDLRKAITQLKRSSRGELKGMILDLRDNPGGVLDAAVDVSDAFLNSGVIVSADGRGRHASFTHDARNGDILNGADLVVLVNGGSASASEIVAGAMQDHGRATLVGSQTYGKGSVQTVMPLSNGRAIKLTTSRYFRPSGDSIHEQGVTPDILLDPAEVENLTAGVIEHRTDEGAALLQHDAELREALDVLKGERIMHSKAP